MYLLVDVVVVTFAAHVIITYVYVVIVSVPEEDIVVTLVAPSVCLLVFAITVSPKRLLNTCIL